MRTAPAAVPLDLLKVTRDVLVHLEHRRLLAAEDLLQLGVSEDLPLIRRILEVVLLNIIPHLLHNFAAGQRTRSDDRTQISRRRHWFVNASGPGTGRRLCCGFLPEAPWLVLFSVKTM